MDINVRDEPTGRPALLHKDRIGEVTEVNYLTIKGISLTEVALEGPLLPVVGGAEIDAGRLRDHHLAVAAVLGGGSSVLLKNIRADVCILKFLRAQGH